MTIWFAKLSSAIRIRTPGLAGPGPGKGTTAPPASPGPSTAGASAASSPTLNQKVDPKPGAESNPIAPSMASTRRLAIASPRPVPP